MKLVTVHVGKFSTGKLTFRDFTNVQFPLIDATIDTNHKGKFILVDGVPIKGFPKRIIKVFINSSADFTLSEGELQDLSKVNKIARVPVRASLPGPIDSAEFAKTLHGNDDAAIKARIVERFDVMNYLVQTAAEGQITGVIISGPPGVGKSWGVENSLMRVLQAPDVMERLKWKPKFPGDTLAPVDTAKYQEQYDLRYKIISGKVSPVGLYELLWKSAEPNSVLVFDDCDSVLQDETMIGMLKVAMDTSGKDRVLVYNSPYSNRMEAPSRFVFKGTVIIITNINFDGLENKRENSLTEHLNALMSRTYYLDLTMNSLRDKYLWIEHQCRDNDVLQKIGLAETQVREVMEYFTKNILNFREVSIRTVEKIGKLCLLHNNWERVAAVTLQSSKALLGAMTTPQSETDEVTPGDKPVITVTDPTEPVIIDLTEQLARQEAAREAEKLNQASS